MLLLLSLCLSVTGRLLKENHGNSIEGYGGKEKREKGEEEGGRGIERRREGRTQYMI